MGNQNQYGQQSYAVASKQIGGIEPPTALWCAALALMLQDARRYHRTGKDVQCVGRQALRDVLDRGPMLRRLCSMADQEPEWVSGRFAQSLRTKR